MSWRDLARPIIADVIRSVGTEDTKALRKALREAYPFGERAMHPYKIWCNEIRRQLGLTGKKGRSAQSLAPDPRQMNLL